MQFAAMLGVEDKLVDIEHKYLTGIIDNDEFNAKFVPLFRDNGFDKAYLENNASHIQFNPNMEDLVQEIRNHTYIVTSSPNYYIDIFRKRFDIPETNIISSEYEFDKIGQLLKCTKPCGPQQKQDFVKQFKNNYDLTIGVGDNKEQDGLFLSECDIGILMGGKQRDTLSVNSNDIYSVWTTIRKIKLATETFTHKSKTPIEHLPNVKTLIEKSPINKNVFIITPFRQDARFKRSIKAIKNELNSRGLKGYTADDMTLARNGDLWANVCAYMHGCFAAVALVTAHEVKDGNITKYDNERLNPNVMAEIGYMLGLHKQVLVLRDNRVKMPSDFVGKIYQTIEFQDPEDQVKTHVNKWIDEILLL